MKLRDKSLRRKAALRGKRRGGLWRGFTQYGHGEPIKSIDTRPMAFVFGLVALVMLFASTPSYPVGTQALLIHFPLPNRPPITNTNLERPPIFNIRMNAAGAIFINGKETERRDIASAIGSEATMNAIVSLSIAPNASYESVLPTLQELERLELTYPLNFCFLDQRKHRLFDEGVGASLQILTTLPPVPGSDFDVISDMREVDRYFLRGCPKYRTVPYPLEHRSLKPL